MPEDQDTYKWYDKQGQGYNTDPTKDPRAREGYWVVGQINGVWQGQFNYPNLTLHEQLSSDPNYAIIWYDIMGNEHNSNPYNDPAARSGFSYQGIGYGPGETIGSVGQYLQTDPITFPGTIFNPSVLIDLDPFKRPGPTEEPPGEFEPPGFPSPFDTPVLPGGPPEAPTFPPIEAGYEPYLLSAGEYQQQVSPELQRFAEQGYGQGWIRSQFQNLVDPYAEQALAAKRDIGSQVARSRFAASGFGEQAGKEIEFALGKQAVGAMAGIESENWQKMLEAQTEVSGIGLSNKAIGEAINAWNRQQELYSKQFEAYKTQTERYREVMQKAQENEQWGQWLKFGISMLPYLVAAL